MWLQHYSEYIVVHKTQPIMNNLFIILSPQIFLYALQYLEHLCDKGILHMQSQDYHLITDSMTQYHFHLHHHGK